MAECAFSTVTGDACACDDDRFRRFCAHVEFSGKNFESGAIIAAKAATATPQPLRPAPDSIVLISSAPITSTHARQARFSGYASRQRNVFLWAARYRWMGGRGGGTGGRRWDPPPVKRPRSVPKPPTTAHPGPQKLPIHISPPC